VRYHCITDVLDNNAILSTGEFDDASVNLSTAALAAGFNQDACHSYGSIMARRLPRGSATGTELKDFIPGLVPRIRVREPAHYNGAIELDRK
jgi:hypothetical protein